MKIKNYLKKALAIGGLVLVEGIYSAYNSGGSFINEDLNYEKVRYETYETSKLEKISKGEKELVPEAFYLTPDSLNTCIKQAYKNVKKWPKEFDKRLYRLLLKQESGYNVYAVSWAGAKGISQLMPDTYEGYRDSTNLETEIFDPINNIGVSLQVLNDISAFCKRKHPNWNNLSLEDKRKTILSCYNAGLGTIKDKAKWDLKSNKLKKEQIEYPDIIMKAYHNPDVKVKL